MAKIQAKRTFSGLTIQDHDLIEIRYCRDRKSISDIAKELERPISTVLREINTRPSKQSGYLSPYQVHYQKTGIGLEEITRKKLERLVALEVRI